MPWLLERRLLELDAEFEMLRRLFIRSVLRSHMSHDKKLRKKHGGPIRVPHLHFKSVSV